MLRAAVTLIALALTAACQAQLAMTPRAPTPVSDPSMVIDDRGATLEILPTVRAQLSASTTEKATRMVATNAKSKFTPASRGVVFNHAMQSQGVLTGEIAFKMKGTQQATAEDFPAVDYPGLAKLTNPNVFLVVAQTPAEYVALFKRVRARTDVDWVEPIVDYSVAAVASPGTK